MGRYKNPLICDINNLENISKALRYSKVSINANDYKRWGVTTTFTSGTSNSNGITATRKSSLLVILNNFRRPELRFESVHAY